MPMHTMRKTSPLVLIAGLMASTPAWASWPDDVTLTALSSWNGQTVGSKSMEAAYSEVIKELAVTIANKPMAPAETTGLSGFDVAFTSTIGFIDAFSDDPVNPSPWQRVHQDGDPTGVLWIPTLTARKGLPLSLEVGANLGYVAFSRQAVFGGWGRWGLVEGYRQYPDLSIQVGYAGYVGNEELELGVLDTSFSIGYTLPFGTMVGINEAQFSPYAGLGMLSISAEPRMSGTEMEKLSIYSVSSSKGTEDYVQGYRPLNLHAGFRIRSGDFQVLMAGTLAPNVLPTVNMGFGYVF